MKVSAAEAELVLVVLRMLNSGSCKNADGFPMGLQKQKCASSTLIELRTNIACSRVVKSAIHAHF